ncbi:hypothetical protein [Thermofilum pendens]|uniref:hypothetical protein n=1 Tax=Thermofilum pendens TaxID=2269 RepID=UPI0011E560D2|nr:hypothetical protein [Thermofilum pendens]
MCGVFDAEKAAREVVEEFGPRLDLTKPVEGLLPGGEARVFRVDLDVAADVYILDTPQGARIASMPEIVGARLSAEAFSLAEVAAKLVLRLAGSEELMFLHVLRGSPGYMLHEALAKAGARLREGFVKITSHSQHGEGNVTFSSVGAFTKGSDTLVVADTVATGATLEATVNFTLKIAEIKGINLRRIIVYGFIAEEGLRRLASLAEKVGLDAKFIAMQDVAALASNRFDMPLYGPDGKGGKVLGGIVDERTLRDMVGEYFPGMDQPGDWSERQCLLFNGEGLERGRIPGHLERSRAKLEELRSILAERGWYPDWLEEVYRKRVDGLERASSEEYCGP